MTYSTVKLHDEAKRVLSSFGLVEGRASDSVLARCVVILSEPSGLRPEVIAKMDSLRAIQTISVGVDDIDFSSIPRSVAVFSNRGAYTDSAAEHVWGLILSAARGAYIQRRRMEPYLLRRKTLLVLGAGAIGSEVARVGRLAFHMRLIGVSRSFQAPRYFDEKLDPKDVATAMPKADVVAIRLPLTVVTRTLLDYHILKLARKRAIIVNVGRAEIVDESSIYRLLKERKETRFATDVFWRRAGKEDFDSRLWDLPNFLGTFHTAGGLGSEEALRQAQLKAAENVRRFLMTGKA